MVRKDQAEILEQGHLSDELIELAYRDIARIHGWLGDTSFVIRAIRSDSRPVRRILDIGCGTGLVLAEVGRRLGIEVVGVDINAYPGINAFVPIVRADARTDALPYADVAFSMHLAHH